MNLKIVVEFQIPSLPNPMDRMEIHRDQATIHD